jgi:hypothetical protein
MSIFSWIENAFLFFGSIIVMKNKSQPEIKIKLFASLICSRFKKQHPHSDLIFAWNFEHQTHTTSQSSLQRLGIGKKCGSALLAQPWSHRIVSVHEDNKGDWKL